MSTLFRPASAPITDVLIVVCEKCGKKLSPNASNDENPAKLLQLAIKEKIREKYGKGKIRAVISSCLDVCPKYELTIAILPVGESTGEEIFYTFKPGDVEEQAEEILRLAEEQSHPKVT